jgi:hypothetical protein
MGIDNNPPSPEKTPFENFMYYIKNNNEYLNKDDEINYSKIIQSISSGSSDYYGETIDSLIPKIENLQKKVETLGIDAPKIHEIVAEIQNIRDEYFPRLLKTEDELKKLNEFIETNSDKFIDLISLNGRLQGLEGQVNSHDNRLIAIESSRDRNMNIWFIILTIVLFITAIVVAIVK